MDKSSVISEVVGESYPVAAKVGGRLRRNWVVRTTAPLPDEPSLEEMRRSVEEHVFGEICSAYASVASADRLARVRPGVSMIKIGEHHVVVRIEFASPEDSVGDASAMSQWGVLQDVDRRLGVDELQGLPSEYWFMIRGGRE